MTLIAFIGILLFIGVISGFIYAYIVPYMEKHRSMEESIQKHNETILCKTGGTSLYLPPWWNKVRDGKEFNYHLKSFDGGKNWYAIDREKLFDEVIVMGLVDHIYPGLMEHLYSMDKLTNHVSENGPIDPTNQDDIEVLTDVGFAVSQKQ